MIIKKTGALICAFTLQVITTASIADNHSWYLGAGLGITELDPDTGATAYSVSDEGDTGFKLFGGYDFSERLTVEGFFADLGSAQLSSSAPSQPDGTIDYSTLGASVLWYFIRNGENKGKDLRKGLQVYAHGGLSFLNNSSSLAFSQENSVHVQYGAGIEYGLNNGIALRAGIDLYDKDAGMVFVGVMKRFGVKQKSKKIIEPAPAPAPAPTPAPTPTPTPAPAPASVPEPVVVPVVEEVVQTQAVVIPAAVVTYDTDTDIDTDTDMDGVVDRLDECADSPKEFSVDEKGCSIIEFDFGGVNFEPKSFDLTQESKQLLDEVVVTINVSPELQKIEVQAHTDYKGSGEANLKLSEQRALSVKNYLVSQGVLEKRLIAKGYGESQPIADNKTEEGRAKNRRVELKVIKDDVTEVDAK